MSGICGLVDFSGRPVTPGELAALADAARHRGPDGIRSHLRGPAGFCHLALDATPEATLERQPLRTADESVWLVADLRLDNRDELLELLESDGNLPRNRPPGDAEILLASYLLWGKGCAERLLGDFAFAVWDGRTRTLLCARDPLGVKPLCYARIGDLVCFASEAQQILHHPRVDRSFDEQALADYLAGWPQEPGRSFFRQVRRLPPGARLIADFAGERVERTWSPDWIEPERGGSRSDTAERFLEVFQQAVRDRLRTQTGTVGIALSGGLDSTSIAAVAQRRLRESAGPSLVAYSFVFDQLKECDERPYIRTLAETAGFESHFVPAEDHWLLTGPGSGAVSLESPFQGWLACHQEGMRFLAGRGARALLTGQGGDDLLQGSLLTAAERFLEGDLRIVPEVWRYARGRSKSPWKEIYRLLARPLLPAAFDTGLRRFLRSPLPGRIPEWIAPRLRARTGLDDRMAERRFRPRRAMAQQEIQRHVGLVPFEERIHWQDRVASAFGLEVRHPFLDRRIAELILAAPAAHLLQLGCYKPLLRQALAGILPDPVRLRRDKTKVGTYVDRSLRQAVGEMISELLAAPRLAELGLVDEGKLRSAWQTYRQGSPEPEKRKIWNAATLELWLRLHLNHPWRYQELPTSQAAPTLVSCYT
ncbi:MAG TPA: asparagine synthase-related protein [Thermoanaerobaculia bacterium]|jgi:asparagine synthase (glutamine-hydrolysing)|nr:asparagine synthase-related protein [Thermoanaerobaculia bacterium]